jgi:hypothetical protein
VIFCVQHNVVALAAVETELIIYADAQVTKVKADVELALAPKGAIAADNTAALKTAADHTSAAELEKARDAFQAAKDTYTSSLRGKFIMADILRLLQTLTATDIDWQAMQGLSRIMREYPNDGKYRPPSDEDPPFPRPPEECPAEAVPGFFDALVLGEEYVFLTALSGVANSDESVSHISTMYAVSPRKFEFFTELSVICDALGLVAPECLRPDVIDHSDFGEPTEKGGLAILA